jgi:NAD(P)-dependent dehydrogenase (short-subunit alcohol dehydrogenase family)
MQLKDRSIRVNVLSPGTVDTPIQFSSKEDDAKAFFSGITPLGRIGRSEETASGILFLASDASSYCAGFDLVAVGGIAQDSFRRFGPPASRNLREVRAMQQQTASSSWITMPVG